MTSPWPKNPAWRVVAFLWCLATNVAALFLALLFWAVGWWSVRVVAGVLEFVSLGPLGKWFMAAGWAACTIGQCRFMWIQRQDPSFRRVQRHETEHSRQAIALGPLYGPVMGLLTGVLGYDRNPLEEAAYAHEDEP